MPSAIPCACTDFALGSEKGLSMPIRKERTFYGANKEEAEQSAASFIAAKNGTIFFSAPVAAHPIGENDHKRPPKWQVDVEYREESDPI
jgi:hypothetical protein